MPRTFRYTEHVIRSVTVTLTEAEEEELGTNDGTGDYYETRDEIVSAKVEAMPDPPWDEDIQQAHVTDLK
jgi:hypothetical protein